MITTRRLPSLLVAWLLVVAAASAAIWFVIGRAGGAVGASTTGRAIEVTAPAQPTPSDDDHPTTGAPGAAEPSSGAGGTPTAVPTPSADQTATWTGAAGRLTATCRGEEITLNSILPADGYRVEKHEGSGSRRLEVEFKGPHEVHVRATCGRSGPVFAVEND